MANNRLYLINRRLGVRIQIARFPAGGHAFEPSHGVERRMSVAFEGDDEIRWDDHGWELADESNLPDGLYEIP